MTKRTLTAWLLALALVGCGPPPASSNNGSSPQCESDSQCRGDQVCQEGLCTVVETQPRSLGFAIVPPKGSTYPAQTVPVSPIDLSESLTIGVTPGVRVGGAIELIGVTGESSGQLKFKQRAPENPFVGETRVERSQYEIYVPPGRYDVTFFPDDATLPTRVWKDVAIELDTDPKFRVNAETVQISGTLSRTDALTQESTRVEAALVFAVSRETGSVTSTAVTNDAGEFSIFALQDSGVYDLHVAPAEPNRFDPGRTTNYVPDVSYERAFEVVEDDWSNLLDENPNAKPLSLSVGEYGGTLEFSFRLEAESDTDIDWSDTSVTMETEAGRGKLRIRQQVDASGMFSIPLVAGVYDIEVRTPAGLPVGSAMFRNFAISLEEPAPSFELGLRDRVAGVVLSRDGEPVRNAQLTFTPVENDGLIVPLNVVTDNDGQFEAWVDSVAYRVTINPPDASLPRRITAWSPDTPDSLETIALADPVVAHGRVLGTPTDSDGDDDWRELSDVVIRAFETSPDGESIVLGEGKTDAEGSFRIVLPARR